MLVADERCFPPMGKDRLTHQATQIKAAKKALGCRETKAFTVMFNFWVAIDQKHREMRTFSGLPWNKLCMDA